MVDVKHINMLTCLYIFYISFRFSVFYLILLEAFDLLLLLLHSLPPSYAERKQEDLLSPSDAHSFFFNITVFLFISFMHVPLLWPQQGGWGRGNFLHACTKVVMFTEDDGKNFLTLAPAEASQQ